MTKRVPNFVQSITAFCLAACSGYVAANPVLVETNTFSLTPNTATFLVTNNSVSAIQTNSGTQSASQVLSFAQFSGALGTLVDVAISYTTKYGATSTLNVRALPDISNQPVIFFADGSLTFSLSGLLIQSPLFAAVTTSATCSTTSACGDIASVTGTLDGLVDPLSMSAFIGTGTFALTATLSDTLSPRVNPDNGTGFADNATFQGTLAGDWDGSVSVSYQYTPPNESNVPEPVTVLLVAAGLAALALSRRAQHR